MSRTFILHILITCLVVSPLFAQGWETDVPSPSGNESPTPETNRKTLHQPTYDYIQQLQDVGLEVDLTKTCQKKHGDLECYDYCLKDHNVCVWHASDVDKSALNIIELYALSADRVMLAESKLRGAYLASVELRAFHCTDCDLNQALFDGSRILGSEMSGAHFKEASFQQAKFRETNLANSSFKRANLNGASFERCRLLDCDYREIEGVNSAWSNCILKRSDYTQANLRNADFSRSDLSQLSFKSAILESADFSQSDLIELDFRDANLYRATFGGARALNLSWNENYLLPEEKKAYKGQEIDLDLLLKAESIYREIRLLYSSNGLYKDAGQFFYRENECHRLQTSGMERLFYELIKHGVGYGEKPWYLLRLGAIVIGFCGLMYFILGVNYEGNWQSVFTVQGIYAKIIFLFTCLYFSGVTFTTLGYGDYQPKGWSRMVAVLEALLGIVTVSLFLFNFGRYITR